jgi:hypothetical protein
LLEIEMSFCKRVLPLSLPFFGLIVACAPAQKERGQLMVAVATDMSIKKDMDQVSVEVLDQKGNKQSFQYPIMPSDLGKPMPGTLAIVPPDAGGQTVRVRLIAERDASPLPIVRVVREAVVKVPTDRTALLPMPLHWLCDGQFQPSDDGSYQACDDPKQTCIAGECVDAAVAVETLKDYAPELVFGGGDDEGMGGRCIDVQECFSESKLAKLDAECTLEMPADASQFNVAIELASGNDGECTSGKDARCFLPLDNDEVEGWRIHDGRVQLPHAVCLRIAKGKALGVATSSTCPTKDPSVPICGLWTNVKVSSATPLDTPVEGTGGTGGTGSTGGTGATGAGSSLPGPCSSDDMCGAGICILGTCATPCQSDSTCSAGAACIQIGNVVAASCLGLPCGSCPTTTACSVSEGFCRNTCSTSAECLSDQKCSVDGLCVMGSDSAGEGGASSSDAGSSSGGSGASPQ